MNNIFTNHAELLESNIFGKNIKTIFTTKKGGVSTGEYESFNLAYQVGDVQENILKNRKILADKMGIDFKNFVFANQTHETNIYKVTKRDIGAGIYSFEDGIKATDCLYTTEYNIPLCCFYADCTPIYFYDDITGIIGIIHAGWQGTEKLIVEKVFNTLKKVEKIDIKNTKIIIGPSIRKNSFEVQEDVYEKFQKHTELDLEKIIFKNKNSYNIDIVEFNKQLLLKAGLLEKNIYISDIDTYENENLFSFRRENITGRMLGIIAKFE